MRYEEIGGPFDSWTYDENGVLYSPSGYRCTPQQIEGMLWLFGCLPFKPDKYLIRSDEAAGAVRPLLEHSDMDQEGKIEPHRCTLHQSRSAGRRMTTHHRHRQESGSHDKSLLREPPQ